MRGAKATAPQIPRCVSTPCASIPGWVHGGVGIASHKQHHQGPGAAQLILCPPGAPSPAGDAHGCTWGTGRDKGRVISLSWGSQNLVPAWWREPRLAEGHSCIPKTCWSWQVGICQLFLPPMFLTPTLLPRRGAGTAGTPQDSARLPLLSGLPFPARDGPGHPRGLQSAPPIQQRWEQLPWGITQTLGGHPVPKAS